MRSALCFVMLCFGLAVSTTYDNQWHKALHKVCPYGSQFVGLSNYYSSQQKDRRYRFDCGRHTRSSHNCYWSNYVNKIGSYSTYFYCKNNYVMTGVFAHYDFKKQDRRFKFKCCRLSNSKQKFCEFTTYVGCHKGFMYRHLARDRVINGMDMTNFGKGDRLLRPYICRI